MRRLLKSGGMNTALAASLVLFQLVSSHAPVVATSTAGGLTWTAPKEWGTTPSASSMRVVTYRVPAAAGDAEGGEVAVFFFGTGQGGSTQANVDRWIAQFKAEKGSAGPGKPIAMKAGTIPVTIVTTEGTYSSGMPGGAMTPKPGWALRGGIAEGPQGPVFFKMVGPKKTVVSATPAFDALLKSLKKG